jgi:hypothetical protein
MTDKNDIYIDESIDDIFNKSLNNSNGNSWVNLVNSEIGNSIVEKQMSSINEEEIEQLKETHLNIGEIMALDITQLTETKLMEYQNYITSQLRKYFKQCLEKNDDIDYIHLSKIYWIGEVSKYFSMKYNLKFIFHRVKITADTKSIPRSSYKFCEKTNECSYNYDTHIKEKCKLQHFVHNIIYPDIVSLYQYLYTGHLSGKKLDLNEIMISINTISYVINHMYEEMLLLSLYNPNKTIYVKKNTKKTVYKNKSIDKSHKKILNINN